MKICLVTSKQSKYDDRVYYKEAYTLARAGHKVYIIGNYKNEEDALGIVWIGYDNSGNYFTTIQNLFKKAISLKPDYLQFYDPLHINQAIKAKKNRIKVILSLAENVPEMYRGFSRKSKLIGEIMAQYISWKENQWAHYWDGIIVTDNSLYNRFIKLRDDVCLIHNYPPLYLFNQKNNYNLSDNIFKLVYIGQMRKERGLFQLINAIRILVSDSKKVKLDLIGPFNYSWEKKEVMDLISTFHLKEFITIKNPIQHNKIPEQLHQYHAGLVTLLPIKKFKQNEPTKLFEYMASGIACIGSDFSPISSYINKYDVGICCDPLSPSDLAKSIEDLISNPKKRIKYGINGRNIIESEFNWELQEEKLLLQYKK